MALYATVSVRVPPDIDRKLGELEKRYSSKTAAIIAAVNALYRARFESKTQPEAVPVQVPDVERTPEGETPAPVQKSGRGGKVVRGWYKNTDAGRAVVRRVVELSKEGKGPQAIAQTLNAEGFKTGQGGKFERGSVKHIQDRLTGNA